MISDTLWESSDRIEEYQRHSYQGLEAELTVVLAFMDAMRLVLDLPPRTCAETGWDSRLLAKIREAAALAEELRALKAEIEREGWTAQALCRFSRFNPTEGEGSRPC